MDTLKPIILVLFLLVAVRAEEPAASAQRPAVESPKAVSLSLVITHLRKEATKSWQKSERWPREEADFAREKNWSLPEADVVRGLSRQLHQERAIDAYIKWQLLSFLEELPGGDVEALHRVTSYATKPEPSPVVREEWLAVSGPGGANIAFAQQTAYLAGMRPVVGNGSVGLEPIVGVISSGTSVGVEGSTKSYRTVIREANAKLTSAREKVERANEAIVRYRDALTDRLPEAGGVRLAATIKDLRERIAAGEPSSERVAAGLLRSTEKLPADISPQTRKTLAGWVAETARVRTPRVESISLNDENRAVLNGRMIALSPDDARSLIRRLDPTAALNEPLAPPSPDAP